jgi:hypothetical protein
LCDAGDGQQRADDGTHGVDKSVRSSGRGSWATDECLQSAGKVAHAPCGCGPAPTSDLTHCIRDAIHTPACASIVVKRGGVAPRLHRSSVPSLPPGS